MLSWNVRPVAAHRFESHLPASPYKGFYNLKRRTPELLFKPKARLTGELPA
jgi:hypothetical protein